MTYLNRSQFVRDATFVIHDLLSGNITDPASNRPSGNTGSCDFVSTAWPDKNVLYPIITIEQTGFNASQIGMQSPNSLTTIDFDIDVWTKSTMQRDSMAGSVFAVIEQNFAVLAASGLHNFRFFQMQNLDEPGPQGLHRKNLGVRFTWPSQN